MSEVNKFCPVDPGETAKQDFCDVAAALREWLIAKLESCVGDRVHQDVVPQPTPAERRGQGVCQLAKPYIWFSRSGTARTDRCLTGGLPDEETFDIEIVAPDLQLKEFAARRLQECDGFNGRANADVWFESLLIEDQADDYLFRGIAEDYQEGGLGIAAFLVSICPVCVSKG